MAKKSAKSKGYRRQNAKKPYLSKKDIGILCVIVAICAVIAIAMAMYDDGALKVKDGAVVTEGDNWLIVNGSSTRGGTRYFKLGEISAPEGYRLEPVASTHDANLTEYYLYPESQDAPVDYISIGTSHAKAEVLAESVIATLSGVEGCEISELKTVETNGTSYRYYSYTSEYHQSEEDEDADGAAAGEAEAGGENSDEEAEPNRFSQSINGYIDGLKDSCIVVHVVKTAESPEEYLDEDALKDILDQAIAAITVETKL